MGEPRVAIIDDDGWIRRGRAAALAALKIEVIGDFEPDEALRSSAETWEAVDVVLVDAKDENAEFDLYVGVKVVEHLRMVGPDGLSIVVVTGHVLDDVLRLRMAEAGADWLYGHADVRTPEELAAIVRRPGQGEVAPPPDSAALARAGLSPDAQLNEALSYVDESGLAPAVVSASDGESQKALGVGRRRIMAARERLSDLLGTPPTDPRASIPEWRRIVAVLDRVRGRRENSR